MNQLYDINRPLFKVLVLFAILDLCWGFGIFFLPESEIVKSQNYLLTSGGKMILANLLIFKGVAMLLILTKVTRFDTLRWFMSFGFVFWLIVAITMLVGWLHGFRFNILGFSLVCVFAGIRYVVSRMTPEERRAR